MTNLKYVDACLIFSVLVVENSNRLSTTLVTVPTIDSFKYQHESTKNDLFPEVMFCTTTLSLSASIPTYFVPHHLIHVWLLIHIVTHLQLNISFTIIYGVIMVCKSNNEPSCNDSSLGGNFVRIIFQDCK